MILVVALAVFIVCALVAAVVIIIANQGDTPSEDSSDESPAGNSQQQEQQQQQQQQQQTRGVGSLPPPSSNDKSCKTWMSDPNDTGECFALVYHHCVDGVQDQGRIPANIASVKQSALQQVYSVQKNCVGDSGQKCFAGVPKDWTSVCVARPDLAGKGKGSKVASNEWRMWVQGQDPKRKSECQSAPSTYVKSHFRGDSIQAQYTGQHGHG